MISQLRDQMTQVDTAATILSEVAKEILGLLSIPSFSPPSNWDKLIRTVKPKEIGTVGELYVAYELRRRGLNTRHIGGNNQGFDLEVFARNGAPLNLPLRIEVKVDRAKPCIRDTWGAWHWRRAAREFIFDYLVMINLNVGRRIHIVPRSQVEQYVYRHADGSNYSFRFGITDDAGRKDAGLLSDGGRFNAAWTLIDGHATRLS
jgi:hypothetical protein